MALRPRAVASGGRVPCAARKGCSTRETHSLRNSVPAARPPRSTQKWTNLATVHWYKATRETYNTAQSLLDDEPIRKEMANLRELVKVRHGPPVG